MVKEKVELINEEGLYQFSKMLYVAGGNIEFMETKRKSSLAGTPAYTCIMLEGPHAVFNNPALPIDPKKEYRIIIIEADRS